MILIRFYFYLLIRTPAVCVQNVVVVDANESKQTYVPGTALDKSTYIHTAATIHNIDHFL